MAKRKRLTPARTDVFAAPPLDRSDSTSPGAAPIAQVAGDAAVSAAFEEVQAELQAAQREGRMVLSLPLSALREDYLIRDRLTCDSAELAALKESIRARGQQSPIEVTDLGQGGYGLISGWRRLRALRELYEDSGGLARYSQIQALLRLPEDRPAAYVAMVEENEVRADLSFYERARIVVQAVAAGVFDSDKQALQTLFSSASFSKRSKVKSFMPLVRSLDSLLHHPAQIPERLGLALSKALVDPAVESGLKTALHPGAERSVEQERQLLEAALKPAAALSPPAASSLAQNRLSKPQQITPGIAMRVAEGRVELAGVAVTETMLQRLQDWLKAQD